jgi:exodeoxyribonuclease-5
MEALAKDQLNSQQAEALDLVTGRVRAGEAVTKLFGYAGTGKTSIAKVLASQYPGNIQFGAYTGKAASVLTRKGCGARTIHSRIYLPQGDRRHQMEALEKTLGEMTPEERKGEEAQRMELLVTQIKATIAKPGFVLNPASDLADADLFIVDEVSMVDEKLARDIMSFEVPLIVLGDPAQLPPVGNGGFFTQGGEKVADYLLTKVMRQQEDGAIIDLATYVRNNMGLPGRNSQIVRQVSRSQAIEFDQILVGKNTTRWAKNLTYRKIIGRTAQIIMPGERIICLENHREYQAMNGQQFRVLEINEDHDKEDQTKVLIQCECSPAGAPAARCADCGWEPKWVALWTGGFIDIDEEARLKNKPYGKRQAAMYATYGYAITVHKAQGSEWKNVLLYDEGSVFRKDAWRWQYTGITRASERLTVVS